MPRSFEDQRTGSHFASCQEPLPSPSTPSISASISDNCSPPIYFVTVNIIVSCLEPLELQVLVSIFADCSSLILFTLPDL